MTLQRKGMLSEVFAEGLKNDERKHENPEVPGAHMVELSGIEPLTSSLRTRRSPN
jgi:hypothetical protein